MSPTDAPKLRRLRFHVWLAPEGSDPELADDDTAEHQLVLITHADQLKGELMASQRNVDMRRQPMALTSLWLYCAMARSGATTDKYDTWRNRLISYDPVEDPAELDQLDPAEDHPDDAPPTVASTSRD